MTEFHIGTSGWQYDHWRGVLYPPGLPQRQWLRFYAGHFATVEVNNTFYRLPSAAAWDAWREAAPLGFHFAVKASRFITHFRRFREPAAPLRRLFERAQRLGDRLGPVLYQAPPDFARTPENVARLQSFLTALPAGHRHALEFRHASWFGEETFTLLRAAGVAFCSYDMPGVRCPLVATAPFAYVRFHGPAALYAGNYSEGQLRSWAARLRGLAVDEVWAYFNNDIGGYAVLNARRLRELL